MTPLTVVAKLVAKKGSIEQVKGELLKLIAPTREEAGCLEYRLHQDRDNPALFIFFENWESESALERHMNSAHFTNYVVAMEGLLEEKAVQLMTAIA